MGSALRNLDLVKFSRKHAGWYSVEHGIPEPQQRDMGEIPF
jgi:hypothetical protein